MENKIAAINQCVFMPWVGFFERLKRSDIFVFLDDVQYQRREWQNRNRIKDSSDQYLMLTVPVKTKGLYNELIKNIQIDYSSDWITKHLESIRRNYCKTPFFQEVFQLIRKPLEKHYLLLADLNKALTIDIAAYLDFFPRFVSSSELGVTGRKADVLIEICKAVGANVYYSSRGSKGYMRQDEHKFREAGIEVVYQEYMHPIYPQGGRRFLGYLSVVDMLFNVGKRSREYVDGLRISMLKERENLALRPKKGLLFRVDAGPEIGSGHMMRCLALAQASCEFGFKPVFVIQRGAESVRSRLEKEGFEINLLESSQESEWARNLAKKFFAPWVVMDGYHFTAEDQRSIKAAGLKLLLIDDLGECGPYTADIVLNQNIFAKDGMYRDREKSTKCLLGMKYALLRKEFGYVAGAEKKIETSCLKILVTLGGADSGNVTARVIEALKGVESFEFEVVAIVGSYNQHQTKLEAIVLDAGPSFRLVKDTDEMARWMLWADLAITAGGSTCWELLCLGLPSIVLALSPHQEWIAAPLAQLGALVNLGCAEKISVSDIQAAVKKLLSSPEERAGMSRIGRELIDGLGAQRVMRALKSSDLMIRLATYDDARMIWLWANEPEVRAISFAPGPISWEEHQKWFLDHRTSNTSFIYIGSDLKGTPLGFVRYDLVEKEATVSIVIDKEFRGHGYAVGLLKLSLDRFFEDSSAFAVHAYIKDLNHASLSAFSKAGYKLLGVASREWGYEELHLTIKRQDL